MIKEGKSCAALASYFGVNVRTISRIGKAEGRILKTAKITANKSAKKIISSCNKPLILMESALIAWIKFCVSNNVTLDCMTIKRKAKNLYEYFPGNANYDSQDRGENPAKVPESENTNVMQSNKLFSASRGWLRRIRKRYGLKSTKLIGNAMSDETIAT